MDFVSGVRRVPGDFANGGGPNVESVEDTLMRMKIFLYSRGPRGIIDLATAFREADPQNLRSVDYESFVGVMSNFFRDESREFSNDGIDEVFNTFRQPYAPNQIVYDELFLALIEDPNPERRACIRAAFRRLDDHNESLVDINHMMKCFNASRHPQVSDGSRQPEEVLDEFAETLADMVAYRRGQRSYPTNLVAWEEFEDYYKFINGCFDSDAAFGTVLTRVWDLDKQKDMKLETRLASTAAAAGCPPKARAGLHHWQTNTLPQAHETSHATVDLDSVLERVRSQIRSRGIHGAVEIVQNFYTADDDVDDMLDVYEFRRACQQSRLVFKELEEARIFELFGTGPAMRTGSKISVPQFLRTLQGELSPARAAAIDQAWADIGCDPRDDNAVISPAALKDACNAAAHPSLRRGEGLNPQEMLNEFLDSFSLLAHVRGGCENGMVAFSDFLAYYEVVSSTIDNDAFFEMMLRRLWGRPGDDSSRPSGFEPSLGAVRKQQRGPCYEAFTSPMAEPRPPAHSGPSAYSTSSAHQQHRRFMRKELPSPGGGYDAGSQPRAVGVSPITKSSIIFNDSDVSELGHVVAHLRQTLAKRGLRSWKSLAEKFQQFDNKKNGGIMRTDFERVHRTLGLGLAAEEREALFKGLNVGRKDGAMDYRACIQRMKGTLPEARQGRVNDLFESLQDGSGTIDPASLKTSFIPENTPECMLGKKDPRVMQQEFHEAVDFFGGPSSMSIDDFFDFFAIISTIHSVEDQFDLWSTVAFGLNRNQ
eukprot:TRINITY_DN22741_c0_g1_i1.p1 TRINITY_DN22741_c0_g1~~TRINITY_DN22741_c0_g1_i1.p1  ORF type:complete len:880 (+),score=165.40 TRINITY_DN22741_c0_g1_i1:350-2641(+)